MALLTAITPAITGTLAAPAALGTSNTINGNYVGGYLKVYNASGGSINITFTDPGTTEAGNAGTQPAVAVADGAAKWFPLLAAFVASATSLITVTSSSASSVTYELLPPRTS